MPGDTIAAHAAHAGAGPESFRLLMVSAMYENGGNTTHRMLDGHPQLFVYPFESQLGTRLVGDHLTSMYPVKYRWPEFRLSAASEEDYCAIIDEEVRVRARTPHVSKFREHPFELSDVERQERYVELVRTTARSRAGNVAAFFRATFDVWHNCQRSGEEVVYVGYSPIVGVDAEAILEDLSGAQVLHIVRNPWSAYADTKRRPVPLSLRHYMTAWNTVQHYVLVAQQRHPARVHVLRYEDLVADPVKALAPVCAAIGIRVAETLRRPSWNGQALDSVYPWGTIRTASSEANARTAAELSGAERREIAVWGGPYLSLLGYDTASLLAAT